MDRSAMKAIVDREIEPLMRRLGIPHWHIKVSYGLQNDEAESRRTEAQCTRLVDYNKGWIEFDPEQFDDEEGVIRTLRHELLHVVLSPLDIYTSAVRAIGHSDDVSKIMGRIEDHAIEKAVINLERMYLGLTSPEI